MRLRFKLILLRSRKLCLAACQPSWSGAPAALSCVEWAPGDLAEGTQRTPWAILQPLSPPVAQAGEEGYAISITQTSPSTSYSDLPQDFQPNRGFSQLPGQEGGHWRGGGPGPCKRPMTPAGSWGGPALGQPGPCRGEKTWHRILLSSVAQKLSQGVASLNSHQHL